MAIKRAKPEEIVTKLRQVEVLVGQGMKRLDSHLNCNTGMLRSCNGNDL